MASTETKSYRVERFGPYEVHQRLGIGGMATVHLALERGVEGFERWVALKRLLPHLGADEEFVRAFVREAQLACLLSHPNIVRIFELGRVGEDYFISMEYIEGRDIRLLLRQARKVAGPPPLQVTVSLLSELLDALDYAHRKTDQKGRPLGLVHRDVSPSNLLVTTSGHLKIIDFGIAKASSEKQLTATGKIKGKIAYMAPEALRGRRRDARSDVFSVGVIAHELLTARPLFATKNDYKTIERIQHDDVVPPSAFNTNCPPRMDDWVLDALVKEPESRFQSARQMLEALEELAQSFHLHATARDVASWVEWAFSLPLPRRKPGTEDSTIEIPGRKASQAEADDELLDIIWGSAGGPDSPLKLDDLTALLEISPDDAETDPVAPAPTALLFAVGPDSHSEGSFDEGWEKAVTIARADRVGAAIDSEFEGTEPGGLAGLAARSVSIDVDDDWRTEPSVDSLDIPSALFSGAEALSQPLGGSGSKLPDFTSPNDDFDDTEPSEIGLPPMSLRQAEAEAERARTQSPFDEASSEHDPTVVDPDVLASSPKPEGSGEMARPPTRPDTPAAKQAPKPPSGSLTTVGPPPPGADESDVILLKPKAKKRVTDQTAVPPLPASEEPSVSVAPDEPDEPDEPDPDPEPEPEPAPAPESGSTAAPPGVRRTVRVSSVPPPTVSAVPDPTSRESSAPAPIPIVSSIPAPEPRPTPSAPPPTPSAPPLTPAPAPALAPAPPPAPALAPAPPPALAPALAPTPTSELEAPVAFDGPDTNSKLSIPPPPRVDSKLPAILIGMAAAAIIGSVAAFFLWPDGGDPATTPDAAAGNAPVKVELSITTRPVAGAFSIDGAAIALPAELDPGTHRIEITAPGRMTWVKDVVLVGGAPQRFAVDLAEANESAVVLTFERPEGASIYVDEKPQQSRAPASIEVAPGPHAVALRDGDVVIWDSAVESRANTQYVFAPDRPPVSNKPPDDGILPDAGSPSPIEAPERDGEPPRIRARGDETIPGQVKASVCIDRRGGVQSVRVDESVERRVASVVVAAVQRWRYKPYLQDLKPVPACFDETIPIQIEK